MDLPPYSKEEILKEKLETALTEGGDRFDLI